MGEQERHDGGENSLVIAVVNNMPPSGLPTTIAEFEFLLTAAAQGRPFRLRHFVLPGATRQADERLDSGSQFEDLDALWDSRIDGLIVTGAEPLAAELIDEPCWPTIARLVDWAADHTTSAIWSCLAAQAAAWRLDRLDRQPLARKISGVFACRKVSDHRLVSTAPSYWPVPHSRHNTLDEDALSGKGYQILSTGPRVGVDMFVKPVRSSQFLFMLGHPEYGATSLLREYRRDVRRFLLGRRAIYPDIPENYFNQDVMSVLTELRREALRRPRLELLARFDAMTTGALSHTWHSDAVRLYDAWLSFLGERMQTSTDAGGVRERWGLVA